tara:strand:+ start:991 stop:1842 length:852 start_codon:yes stop_codon:yes gene_type:complete
MQLISKEIQKEHKIYLIGDIHKGVIAHNEDGFNHVISLIKNDKNAYCVIMGDLIEGRPLNHKFFDLDIADPNMLLPEYQYEAFQRSIEPIKDKIITILEGNHDRSLSRTYGNKVRTICDKLAVPYGTFSSVISLKTIGKPSKMMYKIYVAHGAGAIRSSAGDIIRRRGYMLEAIKRKLKNKSADCIGMFMGHTHKLMIAKPMQRLHIMSDEKKLEQMYSKRPSRSRFVPEDDRWYGNTGSFMKANLLGATTYAEAAMYDPVEMGYLVIHGKDDDITDVEKVVI